MKAGGHGQYGRNTEQRQCMHEREDKPSKQCWSNQRQRYRQCGSETVGAEDRRGFFHLRRDGFEGIGDHGKAVRIAVKKYNEYHPFKTVNVEEISFQPTRVPIEMVKPTRIWTCYHRPGESADKRRRNK